MRNPVSFSASGTFGITNRAKGSNRCCIAFKAEACNKAEPLEETITGSTTNGILFLSPKKSATHSTAPTANNMPVLAALGVNALNTASSCFWIMAGLMGSSATTAFGFCAVIAHTTLAPCTPKPAKVRKSAGIPAPPPESLPAIVNATGRVFKGTREF